jgi:hypothetical protein
MTREEFIKVLDDKGYSYEIEGNKIVVIGGYVGLESLTSLPPGVVFRNRGDVYLDSLTSLPPGVVFENRGNVYLRSLTSLPRGVVFRNGGYVYLESLTSLPPGVEFNNGGGVYLESLIGGYFNDWKGNIDGIDEKILLNKMISLGLFENKR